MKEIITLKDGITNISKDMFSFDEGIEEIIIPDSVTYIDDEAFKGCKNLKRIRLSNNLRMIGSSAFEDCTSLEYIKIPNSLRFLSNSLFKNCINLKTLDIHDDVEYIDDFALYNCKSLSDFRLPNRLKSLGIQALFGCDSIEEIFIPETLTSIEIGALAYMRSLKKIKVHEDNKKYISDEDVALVDEQEGTLLQYAIASDNEEYAVGYYNIVYGEGISSLSLTYNVLDYAFAGANRLKVIYLPSELESIGPNTFMDCDNLKRLNVFFSSFGKVLLFRIVNRFFQEPTLPFEEVYLEDGITSLSDNIAPIFKNAKKIKLPKTLEEIGTNVFKDCPHIEEISLPKGIKSINVDAFDDHIILDFQGFKKIKAGDMKLLATSINNGFIRKELKDPNTRILAMKDGTYYVFLEDFEPIMINKHEIERLSKNSSVLSNEPEVFLDYLIDLLSINATHHDQLMSIVFDKDLKATFEKFINDIQFINLIKMKKHEKVIRELLSNTGHNDNFLFNGIIMRNLSKADIILLLENMNPSLMRMLRLSDIFDSSLDNYDNKVKPVIDNIPALIDYANLLERYHVKDRFLYNSRFFINISERNQLLLISHYNANIKRMIIESKVLDGKDYSNMNLNDLLKLATILGVFSEDEKLSQRATTFITEKILSDYDDKGNKNVFAINGDNIHRVFSDIVPREMDLEFIEFFMNNYQELIETEMMSSGFIARVYKLFKDISLGSSSNKGEQRHKKVTVDRCKNYFLMKKYHNINDENIEIAKLLARFYDDERLVDIAIGILEESKSAPRNIFGRYTKDDEELIFDNNPDEDIYGTVNNYSYRWMPKQDPENMFLGKYCSCCAHIAGAGSGIMRASMTLDDVQNLVIMDERGLIIAKMTLWIDRLNGYGVYNTAEINLNYRSDEDIHAIYEAFKEATERFINTYNQNNLEKPITMITIGENRNVLKDELEKDHQEEIEPIESIDYGKLGYRLGNVFIGTYMGDAHGEQLLVYKK